MITLRYNGILELCIFCLELELSKTGAMAMAKKSSCFSKTYNMFLHLSFTFCTWLKILPPPFGGASSNFCKPLFFGGDCSFFFKTRDPPGSRSRRPHASLTPGCVRIRHWGRHWRRHWRLPFREGSRKAHATGARVRGRLMVYARLINSSSLFFLISSSRALAPSSNPCSILLLAKEED